MNIRVGACRWSSKILITFIPCFKAKVRPSNVSTRDQLQVKLFLKSWWPLTLECLAKNGVRNSNKVG